MDTSAVAEHLNTSARILRQFLRSPSSTFISVGSGARYDFKESELPTIEKRFAEWRANGKSRPVPTVTKLPKRSAPTDKRRDKDREVWAEEGPVKLEDIRDPRVRSRVKADAVAAEARLHMALIAAGLHITQQGFNTRKAS